MPGKRAEVKDIPHSIIVYANWRDRNLLLDRCLAGSDGSQDVYAVLTTHPRLDSKYFKGRGPTVRGRRTSPKILDANVVFDHGRISEEETLAFIAKEKREARTKPGLFVGDFSELFYDRCELRLAMDELETDSNQVCCYRGEGFWSLPPKHIARAFHMHSRVFTDSGAWNMKPQMP